MKIVVKVGTSTLTHITGCVNIRRIEKLVKVLSDIKNAGNQVILVSSGAIAMGVGKLNLEKRPEDIAGKQAAAAVGQCELMYTYDKLFLQYNQTVAQILLTAEDLRDTDRHKKFEDTMERLMKLRVLPIINENDTVSTDEIKIGDNDTLAAIVAESVRADLLVLMSDINGLYDKDPHIYDDAKLIDDVYELDENIMSLGGGAGTARGTGGMMTKLCAAKIASDAGCDMIIMHGDRPDELYNIIDGNPVGTRFHARKV
ncbi:MAG: glutamate 5-kinase [Eubacteriales bacterium]|nr:glutamate 5-kinase [Eubacteriales bacterium]MCI6971475.1 glutamate 5-kinase [Eubacterium sp.]MDD7573440.1 glutamate 5-kinase [Eubacteriales bacterium]MDY5356148.1 glutamate 5-kinase [Eubacteriales bacterium]